MKSSGLKNACYAQGGAVLGSTSQFLKTPDQFTTGKGVSQDYGSKGDGGTKAKGKQLPAIKPKK